MKTKFNHRQISSHRENVLHSTPKRAFGLQDQLPPNIELNKNKQIKRKDIFIISNEMKLIALALYYSLFLLTISLNIYYKHLNASI